MALVASAKEVVQILPAGYVRPFPGYLDFVLTFDELREMVGHPKANRPPQLLLYNAASGSLETVLSIEVSSCTTMGRTTARAT